jgi:hypothetical protein
VILLGPRLAARKICAAGLLQFKIHELHHLFAVLKSMLYCVMFCVTAVLSTPSLLACTYVIQHSITYRHVLDCVMWEDQIVPGTWS